MKKVGFLGPKGTFSEQALSQFLRQSSAPYQPQEYHSIIQLFDALKAEECDAIMIPIENSIEGAVTHSMDELLHITDHHISAEILFPIQQCLLSIQPGPLSNITDILSHPQAIAQSKKFIETHLNSAAIHYWPSTAAAAKALKENDLPTSLHAKPEQIAVIGNKELANTYGLHLLKEAVNDLDSNITRFFLISKDKTEPSLHCKTSLICTSQQNKPGSLCDLLSIFAQEGINLTRIESRPSKSNIGQYLFYIDCLGHYQNNPLKDVLARVQNEAPFYKWLGSYPMATLD